MELGFSAWPLGDSCCDSACQPPCLLREFGLAGVRGGQGGPRFSWAAPSELPLQGRLSLITAIPSLLLPHRTLLHRLPVCSAWGGERCVACLAEGRAPCLLCGALVSPGQGDPAWGCWDEWGPLGSCLSPYSWSWFLGDVNVPCSEDG